MSAATHVSLTEYVAPEGSDDELIEGEEELRLPALLPASRIAVQEIFETR